MTKHRFYGSPIGFFLFSIGLTAQILTSHSVSVARRFLGMVADNGVTSYCLIQTGEPGAVIIGVYLFIITFGNGFRYGRHISSCMPGNEPIGFRAGNCVERFLAPRVISRCVPESFLSTLVLPHVRCTRATHHRGRTARGCEANQAKGRFVANVSHEMRERPLNEALSRHGRTSCARQVWMTHSGR